ncbi:hypothetical protein LPB67_01980 [Undibacterium sp. Jales W-56]|uniref:hypothetical protein n=1 Tax=Undibacterium sp. Jales W-56 TaxID=2897325 RepID=UPI0021D231D6|nr:hypothetical protein [Undibacterium sp. Jales W-56]MCU6432547.1 hypothetical protein [Undibacterium sp. Jales W-56]
MLERMPINNRRSIVIAFLVGIPLAWLSIVLMGILAAIPISGLLLELLRGHPAFAFLVHTTLLIHIPAILLAVAIGWVLFRELRHASLPLVLACSTPWLAYRVIDELNYYFTADLSSSVKLGFMFAWYAWPGLLAVPIGLWCAAKFAAHQQQQV